ncbi:hypothetical protein GOP47_0022401 [Adiantum capillus-veneris]|uniref:Uncharacterized protein n=1 Tax=Adiantum capillus-veneris TaxID=13818 RepID=A0A9D4U5P7_ADICA|nr:hypothetical protein GOP47_0022401 [Adiantum capillus-veneris]
MASAGAPIGTPALGIPRPSSLSSSRGTMSTKKSKISVRVIAAAMSFFCKVRRLFSSVCIQDRKVSSKMNISHALANKTGASAAIMRTSSSAFMIFLILAKGSWWILKSVTCWTSCI